MRRILFIAIPVIIIVGLLFTNLPYQWLTQRTIENVLIKDKQISTESQRRENVVTSTYLIYTDHGVFRNDDAGWFLKYNSSDFYGDLDVGKRYRLKVYGWRIPILSMYPNIARMKEVKE
ncbi:MAG: DUF1523 family protein [Alphaproteobacteria bacterium]|nr:DUF1523 family protein [Alphaproteobacteria bacterium]